MTPTLYVSYTSVFVSTALLEGRLHYFKNIFLSPPPQFVQITKN